MNEKKNNKMLRGVVRMLSKFAISQVNSVCHYIFYQENEVIGLEKYKKIRNNIK